MAFRFEGDSWNINQWYLDDLIIEPVVENDLAGVSVTGNTTPSEGVENMYTVTIQNAGTETQSDYTVKLMQEGDVELASVAGEPIEFAETQTYELAWTPELGETGPTYLYGYVDFADDEVPGNNQTPPLNVTVQPGDIVAVTIGDGENMQGLPYNFFWHYSLSQTLYYPDEMGIGGGVITGIQYYNDFASTHDNKDIQIWLGETDADDLADGWEDPETFSSYLTEAWISHQEKMKSISTLMIFTCMAEAILWFTPIRWTTSGKAAITSSIRMQREHNVRVVPSRIIPHLTL